MKKLTLSICVLGFLVGDAFATGREADRVVKSDNRGKTTHNQASIAVTLERLVPELQIFNRKLIEDAENTKGTCGLTPGLGKTLDLETVVLDGSSGNACASTGPCGRASRPSSSCSPCSLGYGTARDPFTEPAQAIAPMIHTPLGKGVVRGAARYAAARVLQRRALQKLVSQVCVACPTLVATVCGGDQQAPHIFSCTAAGQLIADRFVGTQDNTEIATGGSAAYPPLQPDLRSTADALVSRLGRGDGVSSNAAQGTGVPDSILVRLGTPDRGDTNPRYTAARIGIGSWLWDVPPEVQCTLLTGLLELLTTNTLLGCYGYDAALIARSINSLLEASLDDRTATWYETLLVGLLKDTLGLVEHGDVPASFGPSLTQLFALCGGTAPQVARDVLPLDRSCAERASNYTAVRLPGRSGSDVSPLLGQGRSLYVGPGALQPGFGGLEKFENQIAAAMGYSGQPLERDSYRLESQELDSSEIGRANTVLRSVGTENRRTGLDGGAPWGPAVAGSGGAYPDLVGQNRELGAVVAGEGGYMGSQYYRALLERASGRALGEELAGKATGGCAGLPPSAGRPELGGTGSAPARLSSGYAGSSGDRRASSERSVLGAGIWSKPGAASAGAQLLQDKPDSDQRAVPGVAAGGDRLRVAPGITYGGNRNNSGSGLRGFIPGAGIWSKPGAASASAQLLQDKPDSDQRAVAEVAAGEDSLRVAPGNTYGGNRNNSGSDLGGVIPGAGIWSTPAGGSENATVLSGRQDSGDEHIPGDAAAESRLALAPGVSAGGSRYNQGSGPGRSTLGAGIWSRPVGNLTDASVLPDRRVPGRDFAPDGDDMDWSRLQLAPEVTVAADSNAQRTGSGNSVLGAGTWSKPSGVSEYEPLPLQVPDSVGAVVPPGGEGTGRLQLAAGGLYNKQSLPNGLSVDGPGTPNGEQTGPEGTLADGFEHTKKVLQIFPAVDAADYAAARSENPIGNSGYGLGQRPSLEVGYTERDTLPAVTVDPAGDRVPVGGLGGFAVDPLMRTKRKRDEGNRSAAADFLGDFSEEFVKHPRTKLRIHGIKNGKKKLQGNKELKGKKTTFVDEE